MLLVVNVMYTVADNILDQGAMYIKNLLSLSSNQLFKEVKVLHIPLKLYILDVDGKTRSVCRAEYCSCTVLFVYLEPPSFMWPHTKRPHLFFWSLSAGDISHLISPQPTGESTAAEICIHLSQQSGRSEAEREGGGGVVSVTAALINTLRWDTRRTDECLTNSVRHAAVLLELMSM